MTRFTGAVIISSIAMVFAFGALLDEGNWKLFVAIAVFAFAVLIGGGFYDLISRARALEQKVDRFLRKNSGEVSNDIYITSAPPMPPSVPPRPDPFKGPIA